MSGFRFGIGSGVILIIALHMQPAHAQLRAEPPEGSLKAGQRVLVDDGSCPAGQIKEVVGGSNLKTVNAGCGGIATVARGHGSHRTKRCIAAARMHAVDPGNRFGNAPAGPPSRRKLQVVTFSTPHFNPGAVADKNASKKRGLTPIDINTVVPGSAPR
jgi:hypothetical protein